MQRIVVAAKAGDEETWVADAAAELAQQTGASVSVVSVDDLDVETLSTMPRSEFTERAHETANTLAERIREAGVEADATIRPGRAVPGVLVFAEEQEADVILVGASRRGAVAKRLLGDTALELVRRSRRPVLVISAPR